MSAAAAAAAAAEDVEVPVLDDMQHGAPPMEASVAAMPGSAGGPMRQPRPEEYAHFVSIYPCYLNAAYTTAQGRKLPLDKLVGCQQPWPHDIAEAAARLGYGPLIILEPKRHPRDFFVVGRVRVELKTKEGIPKIPRISSKHALLEELARVLPTLDSRRRRLAQMEAMRQQQVAMAAAAGPPGVKVNLKKKAKKGK